MNRIGLYIFLIVFLIHKPVFAQVQNNASDRIIRADFKKAAGKFSREYEECVGAGRASEGLRADWQEQLRLVKKAIGFKYIRFHGLLSDEMHVYKEDKEGNPSYNWQYVDKLFDFLLSINMRPFVELGFMPPDLASGTKTIFWWKGNVTPPKSYEKWSSLINALVKHFEERYGRAEVAQWYFEVWNEPNLHGFFDGTMEQYFKLYEATVKAIKSVSPTYRVGGPTTAGSKWIHETIDICSSRDLPIDFISTHSYNTKTVLDEFGLGKRRMLAPDYLSSSVKTTRAIIDSSIYKNIELHYTEFNSSPSSRDPIHDTYQNAAYLLNTLKNTEHAANSMSYWTFTDIFEEAGPAMTSFHGGFGLLNLQGIKKPSYFSYQFLHQLGGTELVNKDSCSWVCRDKSGVQALFWNLTLPYGAGSEFDEVRYREKIPSKNIENVSLQINNLPNGKYELAVYRVGYHYNDAYTAWLEMGAPANINRQEESELKKKASGAPVSKKQIRIVDGSFSQQFPVNENDIYFIKLKAL